MCLALFLAEGSSYRSVSSPRLPNERNKCSRLAVAVARLPDMVVLDDHGNYLQANTCSTGFYCALPLTHQLIGRRQGAVPRLRASFAFACPPLARSALTSGPFAIA